MNYTFSEYKKSEILRNHLNLGGKNDKGGEIAVTSLYIERDGKPYIGVMGEYHFVRAKQEDWYEELCKMRAGGVSIVATYLFWIYHEEIEGEFDFSGDRNVRKFISDAKRAGLDVVIRIGPWAHGECRNGGLPDWLLKKPYKLRDNNPEYMAQVRVWYEKIYEQVKGMFYADGGNIIAVQIENELVDAAEHLLSLKKLAQEIGFNVPLYTVTGWNSVHGAKIPVDDVLPVFGGYCEAPWEKQQNKLPPSHNYEFNRERNDTAVGADILSDENDDDWQLPYERYPFATCEIGAGIQVTHHRRPIISPMDTYAMSLAKLGSGSNLIGYYMYHGGTNKIGRLSTLNESRATGYPNDYPILSYDFQAPISEYGEIRKQYGMLNLLHLFVEDFGGILAPMETVDAAKRVDASNTEDLRYCMRSDGKSGFVFVNHYQRLLPLRDIKNARITAFDTDFPPIDVIGDVCFIMPFNIKLGTQKLEYATTQLICRSNNTYFFAAPDNVKPRYKTDGKIIEPEINSTCAVGDIKIVTLDFESACRLRRLDGEIYIGKDCDVYMCGGKLKSAQGGKLAVIDNAEFKTVYTEEKREDAVLTVSPSCPFDVKYMEELRIGGDRKLSFMKLEVSSDKGFVQIDFPCDAAQIYVNGEPAADEYYFGKPWRIPARLLYNADCRLVMSEMKDDFYREF